MLSPPEAAPSSRDRHLFGPGPKRILALDGGGVRAAISVSFLAQLEKTIDEIEGKPTRLCDWFDLIGGTSAGSILATALAMGMRVSEIKELQTALAPSVFRKRFWRFAGFRATFDKRNLVRELTKFIGDRTLGSEDLKTGLCIITKRLDTGSAWTLSNNPKGRFWETCPNGTFTGNKHYPLVNIVRASAAAPHFFDPESIDIVDGEPPGLFIDGALTPHNNPAFQLFMLATLPQYGISWPANARDLMIVSIGTGSYRSALAAKDLRWAGNIGMTLMALTAQMSESQHLIATLMTWLGDCPVEWPLGLDLPNLGKTHPPSGPMFKYLRYDVLLESRWLEETLGLKLSQRQLASFRRIDVPTNMAAFFSLGEKAAALQIKHADLT